MVYKICLVDEDKEFESTIDGFFDYIFSQNSKEYELTYLNPNWIEIEDLIDKISNLDCNAVLIDYKLMLSYDGRELIAKLNYKNPYLPKVILTSDPNDFLEKSIEFRAFDKSVVDTSDTDWKWTDFFKVLISSIDEYQQLLSALEEEFHSLEDKVQSNTITPKQLNRFLELDEEITKTYWLDSKINKSILDKTQIGDLQEIIALAQEIVSNSKE